MSEPALAAAPGVGASLAGLLGGRSVTLLERERIGRLVVRLRLHADGGEVNVVVKRVDPETAERVEHLLGRWLPAVGLGGIGPELLGALPTRAGGVRLVYGDLGERTLAASGPAVGAVGTTLTLVAGLHRAFAEHPLLPEVSRCGTDRGGEFFVASVQSALEGLYRLESAAVTPRLMRRLERLHEERDSRLALLSEEPRTLVHGDLWTTNVIVTGGRSPSTRLIDWDRCGVGHPSYDLSAFLLRFPPGRREALLQRYETESGVRRPRAMWNALFETAEGARLACCAVWAARAFAEGEPAWGSERLAAIDGWFDGIDRVVPE